MLRKPAIVVAVLAVSLTAAVAALAAPARAPVHAHPRPPLPPRGLPFTGSHLLAYTSLAIALITGGLLLRLLAPGLSSAPAGRVRAAEQGRAAARAGRPFGQARSSQRQVLPNPSREAAARRRMVRRRISGRWSWSRRLRVSSRHGDQVLRPYLDPLLLQRHRQLLRIGDAVSSGDAEAIVRLRREIQKIDQLLYRSGPTRLATPRERIGDVGQRNLAEGREDTESVLVTDGDSESFSYANRATSISRYVGGCQPTAFERTPRRSPRRDAIRV